jgi:hypothetical protein
MLPLLLLVVVVLAARAHLQVRLLPQQLLLHFEQQGQLPPPVLPQLQQGRLPLRLPQAVPPLLNLPLLLCLRLLHHLLLMLQLLLLLLLLHWKALIGVPLRAMAAPHPPRPAPAPPAAACAPGPAAAPRPAAAAALGPHA